MKNEKISLVFFGSGPVAAEQLRQIKDVFKIEAVVTKTATKDVMSQIIPDADTYTADKKSEVDDLFTTQKFESSVAFLVDYGVILSTKVISSFENGIINSHFSLLPELRGADPISFAILEGKTKTGVSLMLLVEAMDEGPLLSIGEVQMADNETTKTLTSKLIQLSTQLVTNALPSYVRQTKSTTSGVVVQPRSQEDVCASFGRSFKPTYTRKLTKSDGIIDWNKPAIQLDREIRAFIEWPKSKANIGSVEVIITAAHWLPGDNPELKPGDVESASSPLVVQCGEGMLCIELLKPIGKKEMDARAFLAGYKDRISVTGN